MKIKVSKPTYSLGEAIIAEIVYENPTTMPQQLENPSKSFDVVMHVVGARNKEDLNYTMGTMGVTIIDKATDRYVLTQPAKEQIEIDPATSFQFTSDLNNRLYLRPGKFDCFLTDSDKESNHLTITILFDNTAVDYLYALALDPQQIYGRREWAMDWLRKLYPEFRLDLPLDEDPAEVRVRKEAANKVIGEKFFQWWQDNKKTINLREMVGQ
ncbi:MAG: hypothetical protein MUO63_21950 [Desulfobulbaceae bacterium]|nr:hypothetical protein [Desulfobulbaceae bacterium]